MSNPFLPLLADIFISSLKINLKISNNDFPKIWIRHSSNNRNIRYRFLYLKK